MIRIISNLGDKERECAVASSRFGDGGVRRGRLA